MHLCRRIALITALSGVIGIASSCVQASRPAAASMATSETEASQPATPPAPATPSRASSANASPPAATQPVKAQGFSATTLAGATLRFPQDYRGKLVLVSFWATWCPHCRNEIQFWRAAYDKYHADGLEMIGVLNEGGRGDMTAEKAVDFMKQQNIVWPVAFQDAPRLAGLYRATKVPMSFLVDADTGLIVADKINVRKDALLPAIAAQLAAKNASAHPVTKGPPAAQ